MAARPGPGLGRWCFLHVVWAWAPLLMEPALLWVSRWGTHQVLPRRAGAQGRCTPWAGVAGKALGWGWDDLLPGVSFLGESGYSLILAVRLKLAWASGGSGREAGAGFQHKILPPSSAHPRASGCCLDTERMQDDADNCEVPSRFLATGEHPKPHLWEVLRVSPGTDGSRWHLSMGVVAEKS